MCTRNARSIRVTHALTRQKRRAETSASTSVGRVSLEPRELGDLYLLQHGGQMTVDALFAQILFSGEGTHTREQRLVNGVRVRVRARCSMT